MLTTLKLSRAAGLDRAHRDLSRARERVAQEERVYGKAHVARYATRDLAAAELRMSALATSAAVELT
jgi:hypothetical protein